MNEGAPLAATLQILGSIVADNSVGMNATNPDFSHELAGTLDVDYSLIGDTSGLALSQLFAIAAGTGNLTDVDPLLGPLAYNGGPTKTHALLSGSPAIDTGDPTIAPDPTEFDQRGGPFRRVAQGTQGSSAIIDMGASERQGMPNLDLLVDTAVDESDGDYSSGDLSFREALGLANGDLGHNDITFDPALSGSVIELVLGQLDITDSVTIDGPGADRLTIDAQQDSRVFSVDDGDDTAHQEVTISGLTITGGQVEGDGAGIRARERLQLLGSTVSGNATTGAGLGMDGGGVCLRMFGGMTSTIESSTIADNATVSTGGGLFVASEAGDLLEIRSSTFSGNAADFSGGGLRLTGGGMTHISHSTVAFNVGDADMFGFGGVGGIFDSTGLVRLDHTIVGSNIDTTGPEDDLDGTFLANFSLIGDTTGATINGANNLLNLDPRLGPLTDNGGPTETHAPFPSSLAIDGGDPFAMAGVGNIPAYDQRGMPFGRVEDGNNSGSSVIDLGAIEVQPPGPVCDFDGINGCDIADIDALIMEIVAGTNNLLYDLSGDGIVDLTDRDKWLAEAGALNLPSGNPYLLGDSNLDGTVDGQDFLSWNNNKFNATGTWSMADWNADGTTDGQDFIIWNGNKFTSSDEENWLFLPWSAASYRRFWEHGDRA